MFNSLRMLRVIGEWPASESLLAESLESGAFEPCGSFQETSYGFEPPVGDVLARRVMGVHLMQLRVQTRVLPNGAINEALEERIKAFKDRTGRDPGRGEKQSLKEEVHADLVPRSLLKSDRVRAVYLERDEVLAIGSATDKHVEAFVDLVAEAVGVSVAPLEYKQPPAQFMMQLFNGEAPQGFNLGRECRMRDSVERGSSVTWLDMDIADRAARQLLDDGMQIDRIAFSFEGVLKGTVDQDWTFRKLKLEGQESDGLEPEEPEARLDADIVLLGGTLSRLLAALT